MSVHELLAVLADGCREVVGSAEVAVLSFDGTLRPHLIAVPTTRLDRATLAGSEPLTVDDLDRGADPWHAWAQRLAAQAGYASVHCAPLRRDGSVAGVLMTFHEGVAPLAWAKQGILGAIADLTAVALLEHREAQRARSEVRRLQRALDSRVVIEQASGLLAGRFTIDVGQAFQRLRQYARAHNHKLTDLARKLVSGDTALALTVASLEPPQPPG